MSEPLTETTAPRFDPASIETFRFTGRSFDPASMTAKLRYALDDAVEFEETISFPGGRIPTGPAALEALGRALDLLHITAGVSYYKTAAPPTVDTGDLHLTEADARFYSDLYRFGLAEFAYTSGLPLPPENMFGASPGGESVPGQDPPAEGARRTAVPVGGGKDSITTIELIRQANEPMVLLRVGDSDVIQRTIDQSGLPQIDIGRALSPNLVELNERGAHNGHVPITAILSATFVVASILHGFDAIAMSNERSASAGNLEWDGVEVNHQWSKGIAFERALRAKLAGDVPGLDYFSLLRGVSELAIARAFAKLTDYHGVFTSCNTVFRRDPARRGLSWCGDCPKCRFVFLILAPFTTPEQLGAIFAKDMLDDPRQLSGYKALLGIDEHKPFECVGEVEESVAAFRLLAADERWRHRQVVAAIDEHLLQRIDPAAGTPEEAFELSDDHFVPERLEAAVREYFSS